MRKARVISGWSASYPDPIQLKAGTRLRLDGRSDNWDGHIWVWAQAPDGREGWVPDCLLTATQPVTAKDDYSAHELSCVEGQVLIVERQQHGWAFCRNDLGQNGWVPLRNLSIADGP